MIALPGKLLKVDASISFYKATLTFRHPRISPTLTSQLDTWSWTVKNDGQDSRVFEDFSHLLVIDVSSSEVICLTSKNTIVLFRRFDFEWMDSFIKDHSDVL